MKLGRNLGKTFLDYYKMTSLIMPKPTAGPNIHQMQVGRTLKSFEGFMLMFYGF